jgi:hypothetical protein
MNGEVYIKVTHEVCNNNNNNNNAQIAENNIKMNDEVYINVTHEVYNNIIIIIVIIIITLKRALQSW